MHGIRTFIEIWAENGLKKCFCNVDYFLLHDICKSPTTPIHNMADKTPSKVGTTTTQADSDKHYVQKAEKIRATKSRKLVALKGKNKVVGLLLGCGVLGIYGYTMFSVRKGKLMEAFDKVPE